MNEESARPRTAANPIFVFDLGGVISVTPKGGLSVPPIYRIADHCGVDREELRKRLWSKDLEFKTGKIDEEQYLTETLREMGKCLLPGETAYWLLHDSLEGLVLENKEVTVLIAELRERFRVFALSNITRPQLEYVRELELERAFDRVFTSCEIGFKKPDERAYKRVLKEVGTDASAVIFIDDKTENLESAKRLGMKTIKFTTAEDLRREIDVILQESDA